VTEPRSVCVRVCVCVNDNTENVEDLVFSQEDNPKTHRLNREISCEIGIH